MFRMGSADKKTRKKRTRKITKPLSSPTSGTVQTTAPSSLPSFLPDLTPPKSEQEEIQDLQRKMDEDSDTNSPLPAVAKSSNPYLGGNCLFCHCKRTEVTTNDADNNMLDGNQLPLWMCSNCRKTVDEEDKRNATMASLLISMEQDLKLEPPSIPPLEPITSPSNSPTSSSEPTTPNGSVCNCGACTARRMIEREQEKENAELKEVWHELGHAVRYVYREAGTGMSQTADGDSPGMPDEAKMKEHVHRLCMRDPHHLFQQLECQGRDYVIEMKVRLLKQLTAGHKTPPQAKQFVAMLLEEYKNLCTAASTLACYLAELMEHLKRFNLTWELHNKHLFQSIIYTDPVVQNSLPMLMTQLRLGAASKEAYHEATYPNILHRYLKFDDEMSVISVVWRDCEQLLENYNDEQASRAELLENYKDVQATPPYLNYNDEETAIKAKQKMMKEDLDFFMAQRKLLEENVLKNMPMSPPVSATVAPPSTHPSHTKRDAAHSLEAQFSERMRSILQGNRSSEGQSLCPNCNRKVCPCDECSINHTVFCGIINPEVAEQMPIHSSGYPQDPSRYIIDVKAPSMSSISSSSGSESPITVDPERLSFPFDENFQLEDEGDDIQEDIDDKISDSPDSDDETSTDEFEEEEDGGLSTEKSRRSGDSCKRGGGGGSAEREDPGERQQGDGQENLVVSSIFVPGSEGNPAPESPCDCTHCAQASILQKTSEEALVGVGVSQPCQCHACLMQTGQSLTTSLPQQLPSAPRPAALHLYPHIHGSNSNHPSLQAEQMGHTMQSVLRPHVYELHGMHHTTNTGQKSFTNIHNNKSQQQQPGGFNFDLNSHDLYNAFDWDTAPFDTAKLNMFGAGHKYTTNNVTSELLNTPTPPLLTGNPFLKDLSCGGVDNSLANLMKTSTVLQHCVSAAKPLTSTTVTTSTGITTSIQGLSEANTSAAQSAFSETQNKIFKVSKALLNQQQQNKPRVSHSNHLSPGSAAAAAHLQMTSTATSSTFTFGLPSPLNKNLAGPLGLFTANSSPSLSCSTSPTSSLSSLSSSSSPPTSSSSPPTTSSNSSSFTLSNVVTSPPTEFCFKQTSSSSSSSSSASSSPNSNNASTVAATAAAAPNAAAATTSHQLKLNPDFIRAAAALQKNISEQNAARQQQQQQHNMVPGMMNSLHSPSLHNYQAFSNLNLQNFTAGLPQQSLLTCTHQFSGAVTNNPIMQLAGASSPALSMPTPNTPVGLATSGLKLTNNQFLPSHTHNHMTLPTQPMVTSPTGGGGSNSTGGAALPPHPPPQAPPGGSGGTIPPPQGSISNISVGTSTPTCTDPDCDGNHDNDNDSIDDSCSEQSSSTSTSNQKDGKYCDCCYCEFFGHTTPPTVPISKNYPEMRERLRKRLKIKNEKKKGGPVNVNPDCPMAGKLVEKMKLEEQVLKMEESPEPPLDPIEQKGLDELVRFINGSTLEEQKKSSKAAKRARQKQRKAEEKAVKEAESLAKLAAEEALRKQQQLLLQQSSKAKTEDKKQDQPLSSRQGNCRKKTEATNKVVNNNTAATVVNGVAGKKNAKHKGDKEAPCGKDPAKHLESEVPESVKGVKGVCLSKTNQLESSLGRSHNGDSNSKSKKTERLPEGHLRKTGNSATSGVIVESTGKEGNGQVYAPPKDKPANVKINSEQKAKLNMEQKVNHVMNQVLSSQHLKQHNKEQCHQTSQQNHKNELISSSSSTSAAKSQQITLNGNINMNNTTKGTTVSSGGNGGVSTSGKGGKKGLKSGGGTSTTATTMPQNLPRPGSAQNEGIIKSNKQHQQASLPQQNGQNSGQNNTNNVPAAGNGSKPPASSQQAARLVNTHQNAHQAAQKVVPSTGHQQVTINNVKTPTTPNSQLPQQVVNAVLQKAAAAAAGKVVISSSQQVPLLPPGPPPSSQAPPIQNHLNQQQPPTAQKTLLQSSPRPGVPLNRPILHATRTLKDGGRKGQQGGGSVNTSPSAIPPPPPPPTSSSQQNGPTSSASVTTTPGNPTSLIAPTVRSMISSSSAPCTPDQTHLRQHGNNISHHHHQDIQPSAQTATQLNFQQRSVPNTPTKQPPTTGQQPNMAAAQGKSRSEGQLNWASGAKKNEEQSGSGGRNKKKSRRNKPGEESTSVDEIFLPKEDPEHTEMDEYERELEDFKRFCLDSKPPPRREKLQVNVNLKDIFAKKKSGLGCA